VARLLLAVLVIAAPGTGASYAFTQRAGAAAADLDTLLQRTGAYARDFALAFTRIIGHERYEQRLQRNTRHLSRLLESDVFFLGLDGEGAWITVRDVRRVDGRSVSGSRERIDQALAGDRRDERRLLRQLADEGARYNLGDLQRNFSDPLLALTFVDPGRQGRFTFELGAAGTVDGVAVRIIRFRETQRPTLIRSARSAGDVPASGTIHIAADGSIRRTEMHVKAPDTEATIAVDYRADAKLDMLVPASMREQYRSHAGDDETFISGVATYTDYRRFETSGRIVEK
jgi:hypothetical protein